MSARISRSAVEKLFPRFCEKIGARVATSYNDVGALQLDYNGTYGGFVIEEIINSGGGVSQPFGSTRRKPSEMLGCMSFAIWAVGYKG